MNAISSTGGLPLQFNTLKLPTDSAQTQQAQQTQQTQQTQSSGSGESGTSSAQTQGVNRSASAESNRLNIVV